MIFAQASFDAIPATWLKYALLFLVACTVLFCTVGGLVISFLAYQFTRKSAREPQKREITPQPLAVDATVRKRRDYKAQLEETKHDEVERRLSGHDEEFDSLWTTMRSEDSKLAERIQKTREENAAEFKEIATSLVRIETKLGTARQPQS